MSANPFKIRLKSILYFFFSSPEMPPLGRAAFLREAFFILLIRGLILYAAGHLLVPLYADSYPTDSQKELMLSAVGLFLFCFFYIPFFRVMHRRLLSLGFAFPKTLVSLTALGISAFIWLSSNETIDVDEETLSALHFLIFLVLLPWQDQLAKKQEKNST